MTPRLCLEVWGSDPARLVTVARHAEAVGLDGVYLGESPTALNAETWTTLGAIANATSRVRIGPVIANLLPDYRSPVLLARQGAALAALSDGRFDFRTGVGAAHAAGAAWWQPAGVSYLDYAVRRAETERQLTVVRSLWRGQTVDLAGSAYSLGLAHPPIEITVAANGPGGLDLATRFADRWEASFATEDEWQRRNRAVPNGLHNSLEIDGFIGSLSDPDEVWRSVARDRSVEDLEAVRERALVGTPETVARQITHLGRAGVDQLVVALHDPLDLDAITRLGTAASLARAH